MKIQFLFFFIIYTSSNALAGHLLQPNDFEGNTTQQFQKMFQEASKTGKSILIPSGKYEIYQAIKFNLELNKFQIKIEATGAKIELEGDFPLLNMVCEGYECWTKQAENRLFWNGGTIESQKRQGKFIEGAGFYGSRFENMNFKNIDTCFDLQSCLHGHFSNNYFTNCGLAFYFSPFENGRSAAFNACNANLVENCRFYGLNSTGFIHLKQSDFTTSRNNIIEGKFCQYPYFVNCKTSGIVKYLFIEKNWIECNTTAFVAIRGGNGFKTIIKELKAWDKKEGYLIDARNVPEYKAHTVTSIVFENCQLLETYQFLTNTNASRFYFINSGTEKDLKNKNRWADIKPYVLEVDNYFKSGKY